MASVSAYQNAEVWKEFRIVGIVGIETIEAATVNIYPNPTTGVLNLIQEKIKNGELKIKKVEIVDIFGKVALSHHLITSSFHHLINISHLPAGVYFVKISTEVGEVIKKAVKE